jgi:hypothetical protein
MNQHVTIPPMDFTDLAGALNIEMKMFPTADANGLIKSIAARMRSAGIQDAELRFEGSGDSGAIEELTIKVNEEYKFLSQGDPLYEVLEEWGYKILEKTPVDWYNNDGGHGTFKFDLEAGKYTFECYQRTVSSDLGDSHEEDI